MKRIIKLLAIVAAIASLCALAGCSNSSGAGESSTAAQSGQLVGQWQSEKKSDYVYTFHADGTGQYDMAGNVLAMTYTIEDGKITLNFTQDGYAPVTLSYELEGDRLNIKDSYGKDTFYERKEN